ncbi:MAG: tetratricopeptide repeat protein [Verrucomicrobiales bacterium]|nr:tetratricopeptide repeat protein [Verrucomicrobiales bacterium]
MLTASILAATLISGGPLATNLPTSREASAISLTSTSAPSAVVQAVAPVVTNTPDSGAPAPATPPTNATTVGLDFSLASGASTNLVEQEYRQILVEDDAAQQEVDGWIRAADAQPTAVDGAALQRRIDIRLEGVDRRYREFLERNPGHIEARIAFGSFLNDTGREFPAREQWELARELDPNNAVVYNNLGTTYGHRGPITNAFICFEKAVELAPKESLYFHNFATTVFLYRKDVKEYYGLTTEQQVFDKAMGLYRQALDLDPNNFILASDLAQTYYGITPPRHDEAIAAWRRAYGLASDELEREGVRVHLARVHMQAGKFAEARSFLNQVTNENYQIVKTRILKNLATREGQATNTPAVTPAAVGSEAPRATP